MDCLYIDDKRIRRQDITNITRLVPAEVRVYGADPHRPIAKITCVGFREAEYLMYNLNWFMSHKDFPTIKVWHDDYANSSCKFFMGRMQTSVAWIE